MASLGSSSKDRLSIFRNVLIGESLYSNSIYLMSSTFVMGITGFVFWVICAKLYTVEQVGLATSLISVTSLISGISLLGFNIGIIRFLPKVKDQNSLINTSFNIVAIASIIFTTCYLIGIHHFSPALAFIQKNILYDVAFVLIMIITSINALSDSIFIAKRQSKIILIYYSISSISKLIFPILLIGFATLGIYLSTVGGTVVAIAVTFIFLYKKFQYLYRPTINNSVIKQVIKYSFKNYFANFINGLPSMVLPLLVLDRIGARQAAFFYIANMFASMIYIIPSSITSSFFAEGMHRQDEIRQLVVKTAKMIFACLIPTIVITVIFGKYILLAFGKQFSTGGVSLLQLLALTSIFIGINSIGSSILYIKDRLKLLTLISILHASIILVPLLLLPKLSLTAVGLVWIAGHAFIALLTVLAIKMVNTAES